MVRDPIYTESYEPGGIMEQFHFDIYIYMSMFDLYVRERKPLMM